VRGVSWGGHGRSDVQSEGTWRDGEQRHEHGSGDSSSSSLLQTGCTAGHGAAPLQLLQEKMGPRGVRSALCGAGGRGGWGFMMCFIRRLKGPASAAVAV
jgi:hypothetical protein